MSKAAARTRSRTPVARIIEGSEAEAIPEPDAVTVVVVMGCALMAPSPIASASPAAKQTSSSCANPVACENQHAGTPQSVWDVDSGQGATIQGFADPFSVNIGQPINFKISSAASSYAIDIYRMGYYGGDGARMITSLTPDISASQNQPACDTDTVTGLVDCGNWSVSATWSVPLTAVSGVYFARIYRTDGTSDANQIPFVVTDNSSHSDVVFMTSDETWQAYNDWGGYSLYTGNATGSPWCCSGAELRPGGAGQLQPPVRDPLQLAGRSRTSSFPPSSRPSSSWRRTATTSAT